MKFGFRKPNLKKSLKARTTGKVKRAMKSAINPVYGKKGMGLINNPKKALYNTVYNKTSIGLWDLLSGGNAKLNSNNYEEIPNISEEEIGNLIEERFKDENFRVKLEEELKKNGYTMDDFYEAIDSVSQKSSFDGYDAKQKLENFNNSQTKELTSVDILVLWYIKNKKVPVDPDTLPRYFNYGYHINFLERLNFLINNGYVDDKKEKYLYTEKGIEIVEKYDAVIKAHFNNKEYSKDVIDRAFAKI